MNFNVISGGVLANFVLNLATVFFLVQNQFDLTSNQFTFLLIGNVVIISLICGIFSERFSYINGFFTGCFSALILTLFLAQFVDLNWELNGILITVWSVFGLFSALIGNKLFRRKNKKKNSVEKVETITLTTNRN